jgi:beta-phosphoglucomutase
MPKIEAFVIDFDGVLANSIKAHTAARIEAFEQLDYDVSQQLHDEAHRHGSHPSEIIGWILKQAKIVSPKADVLTDETVQRVVDLKKEIFSREAAEGLDAIPGSVEFARKAVKKYGPTRLAIATTASRDGEVLPFLSRYELEDTFGHVIAQEDTPANAMKPDPFVYTEAVKRLGHQPTLVAAIEDSRHGIQAARAAGLYIFGLATTHKFEDLAGANQVIGSFAVLDSLVEQ